jgi:hypothetical protein
MTRAVGWRPSVTLVVGLLLLAAAMAGPPWAFLEWRERRLAALSTPQAQADWDAFRERMRRESGRDGPVQRKVPKSPERLLEAGHHGLGRVRRPAGDLPGGARPRRRPLSGRGWPAPWPPPPETGRA